MLIMCVIKECQKFIIKREGGDRQLQIFIILINICFQLDKNEKYLLSLMI